MRRTRTSIGARRCREPRPRPLRLRRGRRRRRIVGARRAHRRDRQHRPRRRRLPRARSSSRPTGTPRPSTAASTSCSATTPPSTPAPSRVTGTLVDSAGDSTGVHGRGPRRRAGHRLPGGQRADVLRRRHHPRLRRHRRGDPAVGRAADRRRPRPAGEVPADDHVGPGDLPGRHGDRRPGRHRRHGALLRGLGLHGLPRSAPASSARSSSTAATTARRPRSSPPAGRTPSRATPAPSPTSTRTRSTPGASRSSTSSSTTPASRSTPRRCRCAPTSSRRCRAASPSSSR